MEDYIRSYRITLKTLGPVFIGSGETIGKKEYAYYYQRKKLYILDMKKVFLGMQKKGLLQRYESFLMDPRQRSLEQFLGTQRIKEDEVARWARYCLRMDDIKTDTKTFNEIHSFMKDAYGLPYIPGSSLKGAIRTAMEGSIILGNQSAKSIIRAKEKVATDSGYKRKRWKDTDKELSRIAFYTIPRPDNVKKDSMLRDKMAGIRISDSQPLKVEDLILCQKIDEYRDGGTRELPIFRECLRPGTEVIFDLEIDTRLYDITGEMIEKRIRRKFQRYEQVYLSKYRGSVQKGTCTLILGGGAGYPSKTVMYDIMEADDATALLSDFFSETTPSQHKHRDDVRKYGISPHTRKRAKYKGVVYDMGMCTLKIEEK